MCRPLCSQTATIFNGAQVKGFVMATLKLMWWYDWVNVYLSVSFNFLAEVLRCCFLVGPYYSKTTPQHDAATPVLERWDGILRLASFFQIVRIVIMTKHLNLSCIRPQEMSPKLVAFLPECINCNLSFSCDFWSNGLFLAFCSCRYGPYFTSDNDALPPASPSIFTRWFAFVLGLIHTLCTKTRSSLGHRTCLLPEQYEGC
ncbi:hypothetical protein GOODEAATRI_007721 [Goodea atripinnis]|uniref:Uncharacterized protein n=1 Tax=Goodea atripinnis TaxID=208336 RepID=A0ABV0PM86_9TELE